MANILPIEKQIVCIGALAEGQSMCAISRLTGVHGDTIGRLALRVGNACARIMDEQMRGLSCEKLQLDEIWGFIQKKQKHTTEADRRAGLGDVWTFVAVDADTRMVPSYFVGNRDSYSANAFVEDLAARMDAEQVQVSTDALAAYVGAIERGFGAGASHAQIVKTFVSTELVPGRYSPPDVLRVTRKIISGKPDINHVSTSYVERQNLTMRMHMRRLTRLTNAFSKKLENFKAAVGLHFAYYNFVRMHKTLRMTPAMAGGVTDHIWTVQDLVEAAR